MACSLCTLVLDNTKLLHSERKHKAFTHHYPFAQASALTIKRGPVRATKPHKLRDLAFKGTGIGYGDGLLFRRNVLSRALKGSEQVPDDGSESEDIPPGTIDDNAFQVAKVGGRIKNFQSNFSAVATREIVHFVKNG